MEKKNEDIIDGIICLLAMFLIIWFLTIIDKKIEKPKPAPFQPWDEGHLRPFDG